MLCSICFLIKIKTSLFYLYKDKIINKYDFYFYPGKKNRIFSSSLSR